MFYKLENKAPVPCGNGREWADCFENAGELLIVGQDEIDSLFILTVFIGVDHDGSTPPQLLETLTTVDGHPSGVAIRSATWEQADRQHRRMALKARTDAIEADDDD